MIKSLKKSWAAYKPEHKMSFFVGGHIPPTLFNKILLQGIMNGVPTTHLIRKALEEYMLDFETDYALQRIAKKIYAEWSSRPKKKDPPFGPTLTEYLHMVRIDLRTLKVPERQIETITSLIELIDETK